jgi:hypothetical protein
MEPNEKIESVRESIRIKDEEREVHIRHYYGDRVRILFILIAAIMLVTTPFLQERLPVPANISIFGVLVLAILAGFVSPRSRVIIVLNFLVSIGTLVIFGSQTIASYKISLDLFFWGNLIMSVLSLFALYYSSKTLRGNLMYKNQ